MSCRTEARVEQNESRVDDNLDPKHDHYPDTAGGSVITLRLAARSHAGCRVCHGARRICFARIRCARRRLSSEAIQRRAFRDRPDTGDEARPKRRLRINRRANARIAWRSHEVTCRIQGRIGSRQLPRPARTQATGPRSSRPRERYSMDRRNRCLRDHPYRARQISAP
jgi:hypothetical protein